MSVGGEPEGKNFHFVLSLNLNNWFWETLTSSNISSSKNIKLIKKKWLITCQNYLWSFLKSKTPKPVKGLQKC